MSAVVCATVLVLLQIGAVTAGELTIVSGYRADYQSPLYRSTGSRAELEIYIATVGSDLSDVICSLKTYRINQMSDKKSIYNSMQHFSFPSFPSDKSGFRINRCQINQSPLYT